jgi:hypothetical protein
MKMKLKMKKDQLKAVELLLVLALAAKLDTIIIVGKPLACMGKQSFTS